MKNELFNELLKSMHEMDRIVHGELAPGRVIRFTEPEVKQIRMNTGLSQKQFAALIGVSKRTLENWEQGRRMPAGPGAAENPACRPGTRTASVAWSGRRGLMVSE